MTVAELIEKLREMPQDMSVAIDSLYAEELKEVILGYEGYCLGQVVLKS